MIQLNLFTDGKTFNGSLPAPVPSVSKIYDFGQKLGGARKDYWAGYKDLLCMSVPDAKIRDESLAKVFPAPDYGKSTEEQWKLALVHAIRDEIPPKPRLTERGWSSKIKTYVTAVKLARDAAGYLLYGLEPQEPFMGEYVHKLVDGYLAGKDSSLLIRGKLYEKYGHEASFKQLEVVSTENGSGKVWGLRDKKTWNRVASASNTGDLVNSCGVSGWVKKKEMPAPARRNRYCVFHSGSDYVIKAKRGSKYVTVGGPFKSYQETMGYLENNREELDAKLKEYLRIPSERRETNDPRVGKDHRGGLDVTPQQFLDTFGFRGVEFGNWVEQDKRQADLNRAYDAFLDMAEILGLPPRALSLNCRLGIGFGSRGRGGRDAAAAHFEPARCVINLTKKHGAGSLGHEWMHAVDNYFAGIAQNGPYLSQKAFINGMDNVRPEMVGAFREIQNAALESDFYRRSKELDSTRSSPYWADPTEMQSRAFEAYLIKKLADKGASNDYLANIVGEKLWYEANADLGRGGVKDYPYPTEKEMARFEKAFDTFFETLETRETKRGIEMYCLRPSGTIFHEAVSVEDIAKRVKGAEIKEVNGNIELTFGNGQKWVVDTRHDIIEADPETVRRDYGKLTGFVVSGRTRVIDGGKFIDLVSGMSNAETFSHEAFEASWDVLTAKEQEVLLSEYKTREECADAYAGYLEKQITTNSVFKRICDLFREIRACLFGERSEDIFRKVEKGDVQARKDFNQVLSDILRDSDDKLMSVASPALPGTLEGTVYACGENGTYVDTSSGLKSVPVIGIRQGTEVSVSIGRDGNVVSLSSRDIEDREHGRS